MKSALLITNSSKRSTSILTFLSMSAALLAPPPILAFGNSWYFCTEEGVATLSCINVLYERILVVILGLLGIIAFVVIVWSGLQLLISSGDPKKTEVASNTLLYAVGGLVAIFIVWFIMIFLAEITGLDQLLKFDFRIP